MLAAGTAPDVYTRNAGTPAVVGRAQILGRLPRDKPKRLIS